MPAAQQHPQVPFCQAAPQSLVSSLCLGLALLHHRFSTQHFLLVNVTLLLICQCSYQSRSPCKASHPFRVSSTFQFSTIGKLVRVHCSSTSRSLIMMLKRTSPRTEPMLPCLLGSRHLHKNFYLMKFNRDGNLGEAGPAEAPVRLECSCCK